MRGDKETRPCAACGKELTRLVSQAKGKTWYCSHQCQAACMPPPGTISREPNPYRGQQDTRPCVRCGAPVTRYLSPATINRPWACSKRCHMLIRTDRDVAAGTWKRPEKPRRGDTVPCSICGKAFYRQPAYIAQGRHLCSRECNRIWQTKEPVVKACAQCGAEMRLQPSKGWIRYCSRACDALGKTVRPTGRMHNGRPVIQNAAGYYAIYEPTHPAANKRNGRVLEHRWVVEQSIGRYLTRDEQVDHINRDPSDNRPENLQVLSPADHTIKTQADRMAEVRELRRAKAELEEYRKRFGPIA